MREAVVFKGIRDGLQLFIDDRADFNAVLVELKDKLSGAANFFSTGAKIDIQPAVENISEKQRYELIRVLTDYGLACTEKTDEPATLPEPVSLYEGIGYETKALVVGKTLRGGQNIKYGGSVIVIGDVNPNASVIAGGNIIIVGTCRGVAHAGAGGDRQATVTACRLLASQLRIADRIARAPDHAGERPGCTETARIQDDTIVIERSV